MTTGQRQALRLEDCHLLCCQCVNIRHVWLTELTHFEFISPTKAQFESVIPWEVIEDITTQKLRLVLAKQLQTYGTYARKYSERDSQYAKIHSELGLWGVGI
jgi:hypothetical protein